MMKPGDNETITRAGAGNPMGSVFRRYRLPVPTADELTCPDGPPARLTVPGEQPLAFRHRQDRAGVVERDTAT